MENGKKTENVSMADNKLPCIGYLGPDGTFSHQAAILLFGDDIALKSTETIEDVFMFVENGECEWGVVPVENSYEGSVNITLDLFNKYQIKIFSEFYLRIMHNLLSRESDMAEIKRIYSHPQAIAQCRLWLKENLSGITIAEVSSTSYAARLASVEPGTGAIGSGFAAETYGLNILRKNIENDKDNVTRFIVIGNKSSDPTGRDKTSMLFFLKHEPGALYKCLSVLNEKKVNMTRIESRPAKTERWEYLFIVDVEGHEQDRKVHESIKEIEKYCVFLKKLGSYPQGNMPNNN